MYKIYGISDDALKSVYVYANCLRFYIDVILKRLKCKKNWARTAFQCSLNIKR